MEKLRGIFIIFIFSLLLFSCSGKTAVVKPDEEFNAEKSFAAANKLIDEKEYTEARTLLLEIKNRDLTKKGRSSGTAEDSGFICQGGRT
jgi:outer membrane protein assembly factor BamD